jgi:chromosome segregation ATPase
MFLNGQLKARDSEVEAAATKLEQAEQRLLALEEAKQDLSDAAEKAKETVSTEMSCAHRSCSHSCLHHRQRSLRRRLKPLVKMWLLCKVL